MKKELGVNVEKKKFIVSNINKNNTWTFDINESKEFVDILIALYDNFEKSFTF